MGPESDSTFLEGLRKSLDSAFFFLTLEKFPAWGDASRGKIFKRNIG